MKHFRLDNGSYIAVQYDTPVHYRNNNGKWTDFDNTLRPVNSLDDGGVASYRVTNGDSVRVFAADANAEVLLAVQKGDYGLSLTPVREADAELPAEPDPSAITASYELTAQEAQTASVSAAVLETSSAGEAAESDDLLSEAQSDKIYSALEYPAFFQGATLRYENYANTVKESIVISAPQAEYAYSFRMETDGLTPTLQEDGSVCFCAADGAIIYYIPAPYMIDANNEFSYDVAYSLTESGDSYLLTVTADAAWLNSDEREFPVVLDPTIVEPSITSGSFSGTYVRSGYKNAAADDSGIYVGNNGNVNQMTRGYFHADSIPWLPTGSEIFYAEFSLYQYSYERQTNGATTLEVGLYPMVECPNSAMTTAQWQSFISGLTWNKVDGSGATYTHDGDTMIDKVTVSASTTSTYSTWNVTALARQWYGEYQMNLGFALIPEEENSATSRVCFYGPNSSSCLPRFMVAYRSGVGVESYYSYQTIGINRAGTSYISDYTLQNTLVVPLMTSSSNTMPFSLSLVYNSAYCENQFDDDNNICTKDFSSWQTGAGWKLSIQQTLIQKTVGGTTYLVYNDADGTEHYFIYSSYYGGYVDLDGLGLVVTGTTSSYTMEDLYGYKKIFTNGYLTREQDAYGNKLTYTYGSGVITVQRQNVGASAETIAQIGYANSRLNTVVSECDFSSDSDKAAHRTSFQYTTVDSILLLTQITFPDGAGANYSYYTAQTDESWNHYRLKTAFDAECGYGLEYSYSYGMDVRDIFEYNAEGDYGAKLRAYKRTHNRTVYRYFGDDGESGTQDDLLTFALQDSRGRPVSAYTTDWTEANVLSATANGWTENSGSSRKNNRLTASVSSGLQSANLLKNGSMENSNVSANSFGTWYRSSSSYVKPQSTAYEQETSAAFVRSTSSATVDKLYQNVTLNAGKTYTLSAYVKISDSVTFSDDGGINLSICDASGATSYASSETLNYSTAGAGNGWLRLYATYTAPAGSGTVSRRVYITATGYSGTVYVDAVQLEEAEAASGYNLLEDGSFENSTTLGTTAITGWYKQGSGTIGTESNPLFGSKALSLSGTGNQRALQHLDVSLPTDTTFLLSGWGKANANPDGKTEKSAASDTYFGLILHLYYSDGKDDVFYYPLDVYDTQWQYTQGVAVAKSAGDNATITEIYIAIAYDYNFGTAYYDNISLRMEPVQTYTYDENGNIITTEQAGTGESNAEYDGVDLITYTAANGSTVEYTYNNAHDILTAVSDGVTGAYTYSAMGNVTKSTLTGGTLKMQSTAAYSTDGDHTIRVRNANNQLVEYTYSTDDELLQNTKIKTTDSSGNEIVHTKTEYTYDKAGRTTGVALSDASGEQLASIGYTYTGGRLSSLVRTSKREGTSQNQTYRFLYNAWGQSTAVKVGNISLASYEYENIGGSTGGGNLSVMTYGNGDTVSYSYDELDRLSKKTYDDTGNYIEYAYNSESVLARVSYYDSDDELLASYAFEYDSLGRMIRSTEYGSNSTIVQRTEHIYDAYNRLASQSWVLGTTTYSESYVYNDGEADGNGENGEDDESNKNSDGSLKQMTTGTGDTIDYTYNELKQLEKTEVKNTSGELVFNTAYAYRAVSGSRTSAQVEFRNVRRSSDNKLLEGKKYDYDSVGNIIQISQSTGNYYPLVQYEYDSQNQLTKETYYDGTGTGTSHVTDTYEYTYDTAGNVLTVKENGTTIQTYTYSNGDWKDLLT
ncbi:MAG: DNRLRE domain-containing protein, partial [Faecousia sp.]